MKKTSLFTLIATAIVGAVIAKSSQIDAGTPIFGNSNEQRTLENTQNSEHKSAIKSASTTEDDYNAARSVYQYACPGALPLDLTKWDESNFVFRDGGEHWSEQYSHYYEGDDYYSSNWSRTAKHCASLPKGKYMLSVSARASAEVSSSISITVGDSAPVSVTLPNKGNVGRGIDVNGYATQSEDSIYTNSNNGYGWEYRFIEFEITEEKQNVTIQLNASSDAYYQWVSISQPQILTSSKEVFGKLNNEVLNKIVTDSDVDYKIENDNKYPWTLEDDHIVNGNRGIRGSVSSVSLSFYTDKTTEISFEWLRDFYNWHTVELYVDGANLGSSATKEFVGKSVCVEKGNHVVMFKDTITNGNNSNFNHDVSNVRNITIKKLNRLNVAVSTPGSFGDSILAKVENFSDVKSVKISGNLNDDDLATIKNRLVNLRELDMTDVNMSELPREFFNNNKTIEIVKLPSKLTTINEFAFSGCDGIRNISFPSSLQKIKNSAFNECIYLQEVILPESLTELGDNAFQYCYNNKLLKLPSSLEAISNNAFYRNVSLTTIDFAEGLKNIANNAFNECYSLNNLVFPSTLYYIGRGSFANNRSLSNIVFNEGLYQIDDDAFNECDALTEVTLPSSLVLCNESPFDYCDNLNKVTCLSIEPPYMTNQIPYGLSMEGRELYVPALSLNVYKQTIGWDKFPTIKPIDYFPENITVLSDLHLTLPETISSDYKPNVSVIHDTKGTYYWQYGSLTVNGAGTLSMSNFNMVWDPNYQYERNDGQQNYCSLLNNSHLRSDNVVIEMYTKNDRWTFISFPFNVKVSDIETISDGTTNWIIRKYDGQKRASGETSETWVRMTNDDVLNAGEGYIIQGSRYIGDSWQSNSGFLFKAINDAKKNNIFVTTDAKVSLNEYASEFAHNRSWNFIGNPYPSYYDTRFMDFNAPITVWNMVNNTYTAYNPQDDSYILCPGEAFFVQRPVDKGNIVFSKEGRQTNRQVRTLEEPSRAKVNSQNVSKRVIANITISDGENTDRTRVVLNDNALLDYEMDKDATKFMSSDLSVPQIYTTINGVNYAINERPEFDGIINLNIYVGKAGIYGISMPGEIEGYTVTLEDKVEGKSIVLNAGDVYNFSAKAGNSVGRFILHFTSETTGINDIKTTTIQNYPAYSIDGVKVNNPTQNGIYIQNGKKVMYHK